MTGLLSRPGPKLALAALVLFTGCAYFNTFYNAQSYYKDGLALKEQRQAAPAKGKFDKAIEKSALVISRWPRSAWVDDATYLIGMSYYQSGQYDKAVRQFEQLVLAFPNSPFVPDARLYRGLALLEDKEYGVAGVVLDGVRQDYPKLRDAAAFSMADAYFEREDFSRAIDSLAAFAKEFPKSKFLPTAVEHLASACFELGRCAEAEQWYLKLVALTRQPRPRTQAMLRVAACRLELGNNEQAAKQVRDVLGSYKELDDEANLLLGRALSEMGRDKEAVEAWSQVRGVSEIGAEAFFRIGKYYEELKDFAKARAYYDSAKSRRADSDYGVLAVKRLSLLDALAQGDSAGRTPAESRFLLAEVHNLNLGEYDEAMRLYQEVHDSFPDTDWAAKALFAKAWILKYEKHDSLNLVGLLERIIDEYSETEYADESRRWLGLPVPKRAPKAPPPESLAVKPDTGKVKPESLPGEVAEEEEMLPPPERPESPPEPPGMSKLRPTRPDEPLRPGEPPHPGPPVPPVAPEPETTGTGPKPDTAKEKPVLTVVHFDTDKWAISPADSVKLVADAAKLEPDQKLVVVGYCDPRGTEKYNLELGRKRAEAVKALLVRSGVAADRIAVLSKGEKDLRSSKPDEYWLDRRVEFEFSN